MSHMDLKTALSIFKLEAPDQIDLAGLKVLYKKLARLKHPDLSGGDTKEFIKLKEAYHVLEDIVPEKIEKSEDKETNNFPTVFYTKISENELVKLTKEELVSRYLSDTQTLSTEISVLKQDQKQRQLVVKDIKQEVQGLIDKYDQDKTKLQSDLELQISQLEKAYKGNLYRKLLFFLPKMSESEF